MVLGVKEKPQVVPPPQTAEVDYFWKNQNTQILIATVSLFDGLNLVQKMFEDETFPKITDSSQIPYLDLRVIKKYIEYVNEPKIDGNKNTWDLNVATPEEIKYDLQITQEQNLLISEKLQYNLIPRSVIGHAHEGHVGFSKHARAEGTSLMRKNTTLDNIINDDVLKQLIGPEDKPVYASAKEYMHESQNLINSIADLLIRAVNSYDKRIPLTDSQGEEILGLPFLKNVTVNPQAFLKGFFYGAFFDNYDTIRSEIETRYGLRYGGGESFLIDIEKVREYGIFLNEFSTGDYTNPIIQSQPHKKRLKLFEEMKIIKRFDPINLKVPHWEGILAQGQKIGVDKWVPQYFRTAKGKGASDDVAIRLAAFIEYNNAMQQHKDFAWFNGLQIGAQLADFVDTLEKATLYFVPGGQDETMAKWMQEQWKNKVKIDPTYRKAHNITGDLDKEYALVDKEEIIQLTSLAINPSSAIHSSARYFLLVQDGTSTIEEEFKFMQQKLHAKGVALEPKTSIIPGEYKPDIELLVGFTREPFKYFTERVNVMSSYAIHHSERRERILEQLYKISEKKSA